MPEATPAIGHNQPADRIDALKIRIEDLKDTGNRWVSERPEITSEDMAGKLKDYLDQISAEITAVDEARDAVNQPHRDAITTNNAAYNALKDILTTVTRLLRPRLTAWLKKKDAEAKEEARKAAEAAAKARQAAEDTKAEAQAAQPGTDIIGKAMEAQVLDGAARALDRQAERHQKTKPIVRGDLGGRGRGLRTQRHGEITNIDIVFRRYRDNEKIHEVLLQLVNADIRGGAKRIPGVKIHSDKTA